MRTSGVRCALVVKSMRDDSRPAMQRFQCCYVLSGSEDEQAIPDLIKVLTDDKSDVMRSVAAEALAVFPKNAAAHDALIQAAKNERSHRVREVLARRLGQEMPALDPTAAPDSTTAADSTAAPAGSRGVEELAPSGPPKPPKGPAVPEKKSPWPFPGDCRLSTFSTTISRRRMATFTAGWTSCTRPARR